MWLSLIPQLHSPGDSAEMNMRHHHFLEDSAQYYDGKFWVLNFSLNVENRTCIKITQDKVKKLQTAYQKPLLFDD